ncbi:MAG: hypothetical protein K6F88_08610 [Ruminococcus sp.]|nr:hypothetical protein [Ruminococcus sp.]
MLKSKKLRVLSILMAVLMVLSVFSVITAFADDDEESERGWFVKNTYTLKAGEAKKLGFVNQGHGPDTWYSSNNKIAFFKNEDSSGTIYGLKKGKITVSMWDTNGEKYTCTVKVTTNPKLSKKSITVEKGKKATVKIIGKSALVKNVYKNTNIAKVVSKKTAKKIKIKGLKKGKTTLKIKVNGVTLKLKVKVKE